MKIDAIEITDVLRFRGRCRLEFRDLEPGLIAVVAPNGGGKTSLIETVPGTFWRRLPSREDGSDPAHYATSREATQAVEFTDEYGLRFRARLNIDGQTRNTDAVLEALTPDGAFDHKLNDGKKSTYKQAIAEILPTYELFCTSAFAPQGQGDRLVKASNSESQDIFGELLGLQRYAAMHKTAKTAADRSSVVRDRLISVRDALAGASGEAADTELLQLADALQREGGDAEVRRRELAEQLETFDARIATVQDKVSAYAAASQRITTLERELADRQGERAGISRDQAAAVTALQAHQALIITERDAAIAAAPNALQGTQRLQDLVAERQATEDLRAQADAASDAERASITRKRDAALADTGNKIAGNQQIQEMAADISAAVATIAVLDVKLTRDQSMLDTLQADRAAAGAALLAVEREIAALAPAGEQLTRARADSELLGTVPCGGVPPYAACRFLVNAAAAMARIPALEAELRPKAALADRVGAHTRTIQQLDVTIAELQESLKHATSAKAEHQKKARYAEQLAVSTERVKQLEAQQATATSEADEALSQARTRYNARVEELNERIAAATAAIATLEDERAGQLRDLTDQAHRAAAAAGAEAQRRHDARLEELATRAAALDAAIARLGSELAAARADLDSSAAGHDQAIRLQQEQESARTDWDAITATLARVAAGHEDYARRRAALERARTRLVDVGQRIAAVEAQLLRWRDLAAIMSRTGLPDLEIDAAGPTISATTNEILNHCFGPRFSVEIFTQVEKADKSGMKSEFSIRVTDNEDGGKPRNIGALSGGEKVIVCEALMNAISIYVNQRSAMPIRTLFRDETGSALDPENAIRYVQMLRKVRELGGIHHIFFVSHNPEAAAMADAQIQITDGRARIVRAPFTEAA
jgi:exonuclease SbcC